MKPSYTQFNKLFLITASAIILGISGSNFLVDPYGIMNTPKIDRFNKLKPTKGNHTRLFKAVDVIRLKPKNIFLGTSRANLGLDPRHSAFSNDGREMSYNLGLQDANLYEILRYFEHAITNQTDVKNVVIGIDYISFDEWSRPKADFDETLLETQKISGQIVMSILFSLDAFTSSYETLIENLFEGETNSEFINGMRVINVNQFPWTLGYFTNGFSNSYHEYKLSQKRLADLQKIVEICKQKGINLQLFVSPVHASQLEAIRATGTWDKFEQWKREVAKISPFWDFSGYNSITTEAIAEEMVYFQDSSHYRPEVGNLVLNRIFRYELDKVPDDFGVLVTSETIESHLEQVRRDREAWAKKHQELIDIVEEMMQVQE
ncbi:MAG: hypothetical protein J7545_17570 [Roseofilum sp. SBFL]|uniref:hypothetical protein n=1 Tax=unclassified Roseofilum TaxID=2620099 RepID=UPI001B0A850D|nr:MULTISPECIES: hypothetical protein [unclassified Roseofilum]MBP0014260.1 hypothetical protein [Roseofilum sp. SID3]MBP0023751.1 hypothetical protein [Roseofilum sp. SID2]MBP0038894.1 hypothetical protein [Roseofilum sp. SID1]MBP0043756.1 hypothetical protein [Roseofilum sp. SBFL]